MANSIPNAITLLSVGAIAVAGVFVTAHDAVAKSGRQYEVKEFKTDKPLHGYDGQASGGYYCSYVRIPNRKCKVVGGREVCKTKGWILRQECR